jgi:hypothetical protein
MLGSSSPIFKKALEMAFVGSQTSFNLRSALFISWAFRGLF